MKHKKELSQLHINILFVFTIPRNRTTKAYPKRLRSFNGIVPFIVMFISYLSSKPKPGDNNPLYLDCQELLLYNVVSNAPKQSTTMFQCGAHPPRYHHHLTHTELYIYVRVRCVHSHIFGAEFRQCKNKRTFNRTNHMLMFFSSFHLFIIYAYIR